MNEVHSNSIHPTSVVASGIYEFMLFRFSENKNQLFHTVCCERQVDCYNIIKLNYIL